MKRLSAETLRRLAADLHTEPEDELESEVRRARATGARVLGRYLLLEEIGRGSGGRVYRAYDPTLRRLAAVKLLSIRALDAGARSQFEREVIAMAGLASPHIVRVLDAGTEGDELWFAMEWMGEGSLEDALARGPMQPEQAIRIVREVGEALDCMHEAGLLHLDVKPANVLLEGGRARLADFGAVARRLPPIESAEAATGKRPIGTRGYMAPEQARGDWTELDRRADVYGLASLLATLLTAHPPEEAPLDPLPAHLAEAIRRGRESEREARFACVEDFLSALEEPGARLGGRRLPIGSLTTLILAVASLLGLFLLLRRGSGGEGNLPGERPSLPEGNLAGASREVQRDYLIARCRTFFEDFSYHPIDLDRWLSTIEESPLSEVISGLADAGDPWARSLLGVEPPPTVGRGPVELDLACAALALTGDDPALAAAGLRSLADESGDAGPRLLLAMYELSEEEPLAARGILAGLEHPAADRMRTIIDEALGDQAADTLPRLRQAAREVGVFWADVGVAELLAGDADAAADAFERCLAGASTCVTAWHHLAVARERLGDREGALGALERVCALAGELGWDASPARDWTFLSRSSYVLLWPSAVAIRSDPWLAQLRSSEGYRDRIEPLLPR